MEKKTHMLHSSWEFESRDRAKKHFDYSWSEIREAADDSYYEGASNFQKRLLDGLNKFPVITLDKVFKDNGTTYVILDDVIEFVTDLYAKDFVEETKE